ncbi:hypothetical protein Tco_0282335 [Tanacetum coccineum]
MEPDIKNMTLNEYLMYEAKQRDSTRSCTSRKRGVRSKGSHVRYQESYFDPFYHGRDEVLVVENMNVNTVREKEDIEMDEDHEVDITKTKEALQWSLGEDPFLVFMELKDESNFVQHAIPSSISNEVKMEFTIPYVSVLCVLYYIKGKEEWHRLDSRLTTQVYARGVVLGRHLAIGKHFKSELVD